MAWNEPGGNDKDPWGNKKPNEQGLPDLDAALAALFERINGFFGGSKKSSNKNTPPKAGASFYLLAIFGVIFVWGLVGFYTVDQQERSVVLRLGKYAETVGPGLRWNPPLIDAVYKVNVTQVRTRTHRALMLTKDENIVDVDMAVQYVISDPRDFQLSVRDPEASMSHAAESALRHVVGSTNMHSILTQGREALAVQVQERLQNYMNVYKTGLQISKVNVKEAKAPSQVQDAFNDVIRAREDEVRSENEAESYANGLIPEARGRAQRMLEESMGYKDAVIAKAKGESHRFTALLSEYRKAPRVTRERLYLDTMEEILAKSPKILVDTKAGNNMMYLPLDQLLKNKTVSSVQQRETETAQPIELNESSINGITDKVIEQIRQRQRQTVRGAR